MLFKQNGLYLSLSHKHCLINEDNVFKPIKARDKNGLKQNLPGFEKNTYQRLGGFPPHTPQHAFDQCIRAVVPDPRLFARFNTALFYRPFYFHPLLHENNVENFAFFNLIFKDSA